MTGRLLNQHRAAALLLAGSLCQEIISHTDASAHDFVRFEPGTALASSQALKTSIAVEFWTRDLRPGRAGNPESVRITFAVVRSKESLLAVSWPTTKEELVLSQREFGPVRGALSHGFGSEWQPLAVTLPPEQLEGLSRALLAYEKAADRSDFERAARMVAEIGAGDSNCVLFLSRRGDEAATLEYIRGSHPLHAIESFELNRSRLGEILNLELWDQRIDYSPTNASEPRLEEVHYINGVSGYRYHDGLVELVIIPAKDRNARVTAQNCLLEQPKPQRVQPMELAEESLETVRVTLAQLHKVGSFDDMLQMARRLHQSLPDAESWVLALSLGLDSCSIAALESRGPQKALQLQGTHNLKQFQSIVEYEAVP